MWSGNILAMDAKQYNALSDQQRKWLHEAADAYGEKVNQLDNAWIKNGEDAIKHLRKNGMYHLKRKCLNGEKVQLVLG